MLWLRVVGANSPFFPNSLNSRHKLQILSSDLEIIMLAIFSALPQRNSDKSRWVGEFCNNDSEFPCEKTYKVMHANPLRVFC